jgi:hypothetical protein
VAIEIALHGIRERLAANRNRDRRRWQGRSCARHHRCALLERIDAASQHLPKLECTLARRRKVYLWKRPESDVVRLADPRVPE